MHPQVAGVAEGLAAVLTLVRFHPDVTHEVNVELGGRDEGPGAHAALVLLLPDRTLAFSSGGDAVGCSAPAAVCWSCWVVGARPRRGGGGGAGGPIGELLLQMNVLLRLPLLLRRAVVVTRWVVAAQVRLQLREGGAFFTALTDLTFRHLRNTWETMGKTSQPF